MTNENTAGLGMYGRMALTYLETEEPDVMTDLLLENSLRSRLLQLEEELEEMEYQTKQTLKRQRKQDLEEVQSDFWKTVQIHQQVDSIAKEMTIEQFHIRISGLVQETKEKQPQYYRT